VLIAINKEFISTEVSEFKIILVLDAWFILLRDNSGCCRDVSLSDGRL
jgi:hypothetical protein